jgi:hypothetical protein
MRLSGSIEYLLERWGRAKRLNHPQGLTYPSETPFARLVTTSWSTGAAPLDDDAHVHLDRVISELKSKKPDHHEIIVRYYIEHDGDSRISRKAIGGQRYSRYEIRAMRKNAEGWLESRLDL